MQEPSALGRAVTLVRDLRKRCPWDGAQTRETLRPYLVEEARELDQALGQGDAGRIKDELGDLLLHVAFQIVLGEEAGAFGAEDVTRAVEEKMWRRHPHLFPAAPRQSDRAAGRQGDRPASWEHAKAPERREAGEPGVLDGLPPNLESLLMAYRLQERAAGVGFDWPDAQGPLDKTREEVAELESEIERKAPRSRQEAEIGDALFSLVNLARKLGVDPRAALEKANRRFTARFHRMEALAAERGIAIGRVELAVLDRLWDEAKETA